MKKENLLVPIVLALLLPYVLFTFFEKDSIIPQTVDGIATDPNMTEHEICVINDEFIDVMALETYITGVVLGEMPADFELEALKAQAVATRTYTLRCVMRSDKHPDADVCTDSSCCQAFIAADNYTGGEENFRKIKLAVEETAGQVITYQGNLIEATYFSCSGGKTEDAVAVWGTDVPYLQSVSSPGEENAKPFSSENIFSVREFRARLGLAESTAISNESILLTYTDGDGVKTMKVGDASFTGTQVRTLLSLSSTSFTVRVTDQGVQIHTKGNGHRVGMSQYGAEAMAVSGKSYEQILAHYYSGTQVETLTEDQMHAIFDKEENL